MRSEVSTRWTHRIAGALAPFIVIFGLMAPAAVADDGSGWPTREISTCGGDDKVSSFLPAVRWAGDSGATTPQRYMSDGLWDQAAQLVAGALGSISGSLGNVGQSMWGWAASLADVSGKFCPMVVMGPSIDDFAAKIGNIILSPGIGAFLIFASIGMSLFYLVRSYRAGTGAMKQAGLKLLVPLIATALLTLMTAGAGHSYESDDGFHAGRYSPSWWMNITASTMNTVVSAPLAVLEATPITGLADNTGMASATEAGSCTFTSSKIKARKDTKGDASARSVSMLWEQAGLPYYIEQQFGSADNTIGWHSYCRFLEYGSGNLTKAATERDRDVHASATTLYVTKNLPGPNLADAGPGPRFEWERVRMHAKVWEGQQASAIGWMVCRPTMDPGKWELVTGAGEDGLGITPEDCAAWWSPDTEKAPDSMFGIEDEKIAAAYAANPDLGEAVESVMSPNEFSIVGPTAMFISGLVALLVYGGVSLVIIGSKIGMVVLGLFLIGAVVVSMWSGTGSRVARFGRQTLGVLLVSIVGQALFVIVTVLAMLVVAMGQAVFGITSSISLFWSAVAPLIAAMLLHFGTKAIFGGSPFSIQGMKKMATEGIDPGMLFGAAAATSIGSRMLNRDRSSLASSVADRGVGTGGVAGEGGASAAQKRTPDGLAPVSASALAKDGQIDHEKQSGIAAATLGSRKEMSKRGRKVAESEHERLLGRKGVGKGGAVLGYDKDGNAVTKGMLDEASGAERARLKEEMKASARQDKMIARAARPVSGRKQAALARKAAWESKLAADGDLALSYANANALSRGAMRMADRATGGQNNLKGLASTAKGAAASGAKAIGSGAWSGAKAAPRLAAKGSVSAAKWAAANPKKTLAMAGLAATGVGVPAALALGGTALAAQRGTGAIRSLRNGEAAASRSAKVQARHALANQVLAGSSMDKQLGINPGGKRSDSALLGGSAERKGLEDRARELRERNAQIAENAQKRSSGEGHRPDPVESKDGGEAQQIDTGGPEGGQAGGSGHVERGDAGFDNRQEASAPDAEQTPQSARPAVQSQDDAPSVTTGGPDQSGALAADTSQPAEAPVEETPRPTRRRAARPAGPADQPVPPRDTPARPIPEAADPAERIELKGEDPSDRAP